jgi:hypothetical protein
MLCLISVQCLLTISTAKANNNSGEPIVHFTQIPCLTPLDKACLEGTALAQVNSPADQLLLNKNLTSQETAEHLARLFSILFAVLGHDEHQVPVDWFHQLIKTQRKFNSVPGQKGASSYQLITRASTDQKDKRSRDIYLGTSVFFVFFTLTDFFSAVPVELTHSMKVKLGLMPKKHALSDSELDSESDEKAKGASC